MSGQPATQTSRSIEQRAIDTIRTLSMDAVQRANSGHPGTPMALAPIAYLLYTKFLRHNPADPSWPDRDRFVLSAGHASMLQYSILHLTGYDLTLDDLRDFRQWGSRTPGHPEFDLLHATPGVETTTGPLGQGFANGVGMAMAERFLRERYGAEVMNHHIYALCSDGDLMEGVSSEAASLAGHLGLGQLVYLYDDNQITIDGRIDLSFAGEDVGARFAAYGWHVQTVADVNDLAALEQAIAAARDETALPSLIRVRSVIAYPAPNKQDTSGAHGAPLGEDEVRAAKVALGWDPDQHFYVPPAVYEHCNQTERGAVAQAAWNERFARWQAQNPEPAAEWERAWAGRLEPGLASALPQFSPAEKPKVATRVASGEALAAIAPFAPTMLGGSADLAGSVGLQRKNATEYSLDCAGQNIHWGVREHAMGSAVNGLALHGGIVRPYGGTFLIFSDYMRPAIRLSALMGLPTVWVYSHDSLGLGEDGPTHQPVEQLMSLRLIPQLTVIRPGDAAETVEAWRLIVEELKGPACLVLSRQGLPVLNRDGDEYAAAAELVKGAYVLKEASADPQAILIATGSEVEVALSAQEQLASAGISVRVVSMPSWELFAAQSDSYQKSVLPPDLPKVSVEAGSTLGWQRWADAHVGVDDFGASAPGPEVLRRRGITPEAAVAAVHECL